MTRFVIGVDPGATTGLAIVTAPGLHRGEVRLYGHLVGKDIRPSQWMAQILHDLGASEVRVAIEEQYVGVNAHTAVILAQRAGRWQEAADAAGVPWEMVLASKWQPAMLAGMLGSRTRAELKRASVTVARMRWGVELKPDAADAALIAAWAAERWTT